MDSNAFRKYGKEMVDFIADYWDSLRVENTSAQSENNTSKNVPTRRPLSSVKPGYIWTAIPREAPTSPEPWSKIFSDIEEIVLSANTNWHHPNFHAYYPTACSYAAIMGDMLSGAIASIGFTWNSSPAMTELEMAMTDWLAHAIGLPDAFLNSDAGPGGGILQSTASDATFVAILSARARAVDRIKSSLDVVSDRIITETKSSNWFQSKLNKAFNNINLKNNSATNKLFSSKIIENIEDEEPTTKDVESVEDTQTDGTFRNHDATFFQKFVAYCSDQAHSSVEKDVMLAGVRLRKLPTQRGIDGNFGLSSESLTNAIKLDRKMGLVPFILIASVGTTNTCAVDHVQKLGTICNSEGIWLHIDAAYAGSFLLCNEFRYLLDGIDYVDSFNFNAHKAMMINFDCSPMCKSCFMFRNATEAIEYFKVDPLYLKHPHEQQTADYRHLQIALGRRFRALKIWFVLRAIGIPFIQRYLRKHVHLAALFAKLIKNNPLFELFVPESLGLVCFRLKGTNEINEELNEAINRDGQIHLVPATASGTYFLRFAICSQYTTEEHVMHAYQVICEIAKNIN